MTVIASQKNKTTCLFAELYVRIEIKWRKKTALLNEIAQLNCIFKQLTQTWRLKKLNRSIVKIRVFNINIIRSIEAYVAKMKIRDDEKKEHTSMQIFYAFSKIVHEIIVDLFWIIKINLFVN